MIVSAADLKKLSQQISGVGGEGEEQFRSAMKEDVRPQKFENKLQ
jgi:hypothetical protein